MTPHTWVGGGPEEPPRCKHCPAPFLAETSDDCPGPQGAKEDDVEQGRVCR